ncbi:hypothetical protein L195_g013095 [Trifolium pratense]|uniref:Uncharacterized protein n=1 Tax=Trifolium pratense TaxID=57577 RepID=A0A2K3PM61_TRIPR|nr:hypothetical protein L195_g013095 [Trifolium pratense]
MNKPYRRIQAGPIATNRTVGSRTLGNRSTTVHEDCCPSEDSRRIQAGPIATNRTVGSRTLGDLYTTVHEDRCPSEDSRS